MDYFHLYAASKLKFLIFYVHTASSKIKKKRISYTNKKRENGKSTEISAAVFVDVPVLVA